MDRRIGVGRDATRTRRREWELGRRNGRGQSRSRKRRWRRGQTRRQGQTRRRKEGGGATMKEEMTGPEATPVQGPASRPTAGLQAGS
jgi:hypothetical protein